MSNSSIKDLSIQISLNGLSFCILDKSNNKIDLLVNKSFEKQLNHFELLEQLKKELSLHTEFTQDFSHVLVLYQNELSSLIPKSLFVEEHMADYLKFNSKILKTDFISYDEINTNESINVFVPFMNINNYLFETFGIFEYKHASTILIDSILKKESKLDDDAVYININTSHFELIAIKHKKLILYNSFEYTTKEDVIYFILFVLEQLNMNPETVKLKLMGLIEKDDELFKIIYTYVRFVEFYEPHYKFEFKENSKPAQAYHNTILLNSF